MLECNVHAGLLFPRTVSLHHAQELDDHFRAGSDEDLTLSGFFGVVDGIERIVQDAGFYHGDRDR